MEAEAETGARLVPRRETLLFLSFRKLAHILVSLDPSFSAFHQIFPFSLSSLSRFNSTVAYPSSDILAEQERAKGTQKNDAAPERNGFAASESARQKFERPREQMRKA